MRRARRALGGALGSVLALTAGLLGGAVATAPQAAAVTSPVAFTADDLSTYQTNGIVWSLAEANGVVFAGGTFSAIRPPGSAAGSGETSAVNFAAFNAATGAPTSCSLSFTRTSGTATVRALAVSPDKKTLYAGGYFTSAGSVSGLNGLAAIDIATCTVKSAFNPAFNSTVRAIDVSPDGNTVYVGGDFTTARGTARARFAALTTAGALTSWTADADLSGRAIQVTQDGSQVVLAGDFTTVDGQDSHALAVVSASDASLTKTYPSGFVPATAVIKDLVTDGTGVYAAGEGMGGASFDGRLALNTGDWSERWRDTCQGADQALVVYQSVLYAGNHNHDCSSMGEFANVERKHFTAESVDDPTLLPWFPDTNEGTGEQLGPRALTLSDTSAGTYLWASGEFTTVNGVAQQSLTRFGTDTANSDAPSTPVAWATSEGPGAIKVRWQASEDLDDGLLTYNVYRNGSATPIHTTTGYSLPWSRPQLAFTDTSVVAGTTYSYRITASDGTHTTALSTARTATAATATTAYAEQVRSDGAELYWRYDETSGVLASDSSGSDDSGVYVSTPTYAQSGAVPGASTAVTLNGSSEYVYSDQRHDAPTTYSEETWIRTTTTTGGRILGFGDNIGSGTYQSRSADKAVYMTDDGRLAFGTGGGGGGPGGGGGGTRTVVESTAAYNDGAWHHVVATQGADGITLYVDGAAVGSNTAPASLSYSGYWRVGGDSLSGWTDNPTSAYFAGTVDETAIYPTALTADQVAGHYALGTGAGGGGGEESSVTLTATEDSYVNGSATGTNYGTATSLAVRGSAAYLSYLRFELPAAPSGTELTGAVLRLRTTSLSTAGSADSFDVVPVTGDWTEAGVTYANRPALSSTVLGTLAAPNAVSTDYEVTLNPGQLSALLGSSSSVALTSTGADALWLWSSEVGTEDYRPQLVLTFSPS
ncbi:LamG-like jellyroll fold domain-containing protein [Streptomyces sp. NPDC002088]|uniref:CBM96 family carbohydrate-binding protein n=1 Tax=Streptomyces sp. NPDC002088 TaxID=3154665 RepID=UPI003332D270